VLKDVKCDELEALLSYMYAGVVNVAQNDLARLIKTAELLQIKGLAVPDEPPPENVTKKKSITPREDRTSPPPKRRRRPSSPHPSPTPPSPQNFNASKDVPKETRDSRSNLSGEAESRIPDPESSSSQDIVFDPPPIKEEIDDSLVSEGGQDDMGNSFDTKYEPETGQDAVPGPSGIQGWLSGMSELGYSLNTFSGGGDSGQHGPNSSQSGNDQQMGQCTVATGDLVNFGSLNNIGFMGWCVIRGS